MAEETGQPAEDAAPADEAPAEDAPAEGGDADAGEAPEPTTTLDAGGDDVQATAPSDWPDDWKDKMAGDDAEFRKRLDRFASPNEVAKWGQNAEKSWKQGADPEGFPVDGTDEEQAAWRGKHDIPLEAQAYHDTLPEGVTIGDDHKPVYDKYFKFAHGRNLSPDVVNGFLELDLEMREQALAVQVEQDLLHRDETTSELREEYGAELKPHLLAAKATLDDAPEGFMNDIFAARMPNGRQLGSDPDAVRWLIRTALKVNPAATVAPGTDTQTAGTNIDAELKELEVMMEDTKGEYYKGAKAEAHQERYRELLEAKNAMADRAR